MIGREDLILRLSKPIAEILLELDPTYKEFQRKDGTLLVKLNKALYILRKAPKIWCNTIKAFFILHGFTNSTLDDCLFYKRYLDVMHCEVLFHNY